MKKVIKEDTKLAEKQLPIQERISRLAYMLSLLVGRSKDRELMQISIAIGMLNIAIKLADTNETSAMRMYNQARRVARKEA